MTRPFVSSSCLGKKPDAAGVLIDFDAVYRDLAVPAIDGAGLQPMRADEERRDH